MKCPVDKSVMMVVEHRRIELDYCLKCHGVWLDAGELELLISVLQAEGANLHPDELLTPEKTEIKDRRKCPICGSKMDKVWIGKDHRVLIDSCPLGARPVVRRRRTAEGAARHAAAGDAGSAGRGLFPGRGLSCHA